MVVVIIIGILATLAYSSLMDIIFASRAKETAQAMRTFAERALSDGKRQNINVLIEVSGNNMQYTPDGSATPVVAQPLGSGYSSSSTKPTCEGVPDVSFNGGAVSQLRIGISGIALKKIDGTIDATKSQGYFVACDAKNYCGAAVKIDSKNSFVACIKKPNANWEAL